MSEEDGFLSRWSARKRGKAEEPEVAAAPVEEAAPEPDLSEEDYLAEHELTDPDEMEKDDDFAAFMKTGVPEALKRRALRRLWTLNPVLANVDGLVEYGEDYTDAATVVANLQTGYQVGKGFVKEVLEPEEEIAEADGAPEVNDGDTDLAEVEAEAEEAAEPELTTDDAEAETPTAERADAPDPAPTHEPEFAAEEAPPPPRRRMAFHFD